LTAEAHLNDVLRLHDMRARLSHQRLKRAAEKLLQRARIAEQGRAAHAAAQIAAVAYVRDRFASADLAGGAGAFFVSLALGHQYAQREAVTLDVRARRLTERQQDAAEDRSVAAQDHLRTEHRKRQFGQIAADLTAGLQADVDAQEEEDMQDVQAGRGNHGAF
jgi:hypothetical protein